MFRTNDMFMYIVRLEEGYHGCSLCFTPVLRSVNFICERGLSATGIGYHKLLLTTPWCMVLNGHFELLNLFVGDVYCFNLRSIPLYMYFLVCAFMNNK